MIAGTFRFIGFWLLAAAVVALVIDGTRTIAASTLVWSSLAKTWLQIHAGSLTTLQLVLEKNAHPLLWNPAVTTILKMPTVMILAVFSFLFLRIGRPRRDILE